MARATKPIQEIVEINDKVKVELINVNTGIHTVFVKSGMVEFVDGVAEVTADIAEELKNLGFIK